MCTAASPPCASVGGTRSLWRWSGRVAEPLELPPSLRLNEQNEKFFHLAARNRSLTRAIYRCQTTDSAKGCPIKTIRSFSLQCVSTGLVSLSLSLALAGSATGQTLPLTGEVLYGAPGGARVNIFPVMIIDPSTGGFANIFNNIAAPQFVCGGGSTPVGSQFLYVSLPAGCDNQVPKIIGYSLEPVTGVPTAL